MIKLFLLISLSVPFGLVAWSIAPPALPVAPSGATWATSVVAPGDTIPTFPGLEGAGAITLSGCRSLEMAVHHVTNLNGSGAGSLKNIIENQTSSAKFDVVVFDTAGTIDQTSKIDLNLAGDCFVVPGQTAQGGIQVSGANGVDDIFSSPSSSGNNPNNKNAVRHMAWQYLRIRAKETRQRLFLLYSGSARAQGWLWDQMSFSYARGAVGTPITMYWARPRDSDSVTTISDTLRYSQVSNSIIGPFHGSRTMQIRSCPHTTVNNLFASTSQREHVQTFGGHTHVSGVPSCGEAVNNLMYNWANGKAAETNSDASYDYYNNWLQRKVNTTTQGTTRLMHLEDAENGTQLKSYIGKNLVLEGADTVITFSPDQWFRYCLGPSGLCGHPNVDSTVHRAHSPQLTATAVHPYYVKFPVTAMSAAAAHDSLIGATFAVSNIKIGAYRHTTCAGGWQVFVDALDQKMVNDVHTFKINGILQNPPVSNPAPAANHLYDLSSDYGGLPTMNVQPSCPDDDGDGMPNEFELACSGSTTALAPDGDISGDGYLNIEEYYNGTNVAGRTLDWTDNASNEDGYRVERDTGSGFVVIETTAPNVTTYFDPDAQVGDDYRVIAFNVTGESAPTLTVQATCR